MVAVVVAVVRKTVLQILMVNEMTEMNVYFSCTCIMYMYVTVNNLFNKIWFCKILILTEYLHLYTVHILKCQTLVLLTDYSEIAGQ